MNLFRTAGNGGAARLTTPRIRDLLRKPTRQAASDLQTLIAASNYAISLFYLKSFKEGKSLLRKSILVAQRAHGENDEITVKMRSLYAQSLYADDGATLDDLREAVSTLEATARTARRVFGISHPLTKDIEADLRLSRAMVRARETPSPRTA